jgi:archaeal flagellin FlaB
MTRLNRLLMGVAGISVIMLLSAFSIIKQTKGARGEMGVGTLIIFIAIILVAAIAAAVLISTGGALQQKALITSSEAKEGISTGVEAVQIRGSDPTPSGTPHSISHLFVSARLPAGSSTLSFNYTIITLDTNHGMQSMTYGGTVADTVLASDTSTYVVSYIKEGPYTEPGYLNMGDMVRINFNIDGTLGENQKARITIMPRLGSVVQLEFITPETMTSPMVVLWPNT